MIHLALCLWFIIYINNIQLSQGSSGIASTLALCTGWGKDECPVVSKPFPISNFYSPHKETLCKADIAVTALQIDWQTKQGGKGFISRISINNREFLPGRIYPSITYMSPLYPKCSEWYDCLGSNTNCDEGNCSRRGVLDLALSNKLDFSVSFEWEGAHEKVAVCSISGVSYAAMAKLELFYKVEQNEFCPGWQANHGIVCNGHGRCLCANKDDDDEEASRVCQCDKGWRLPECNDCVTGMYGEDCEHSCATCDNKGKCRDGKTGDGECACPPGFDPSTRCSTCLANHFGPSCRPCPNCNYPYGNCVDGIQGNGKCACAVGWEPSMNCHSCMNNFYGDFCEPCKSCGKSGYCLDGRSGTGECVCSTGFDPYARCMDCLPNLFGPNCTECLSCNEHGQCNDGISGDGECTCVEGYTSESRCHRCSSSWDYNPSTKNCQCAPDHFGPHCLSCPICAPNGKCNAGVLGDGSCICDIGWSESKNCVGCLDNYYGENCTVCPKCGQGQCDDGVRGSGKCFCPIGWDPLLKCKDCLVDYFGKHCDPCPQDCGNGYCSSGIYGNGKCICLEGWELHSSKPCSTCSKNYAGKSCTPCPGYLQSGLSCNGHGECLELNGSVVCQCYSRYYGTSCSKYSFPLLTIVLLGFVVVILLIFCFCSLHRLTLGTSQWKKVSQEYVEISNMFDLEHFLPADSRDWLIPFESLTLQMEVGNGTSGQVFRSLYHCGGGSSVVAVKRLYSPVTGQEYFQNFFRREVSILSKLHHPNVVRFYGVSYYNRVLYIVTDFCRTSLSDLIDDPTCQGPLPTPYLLKIVTQITHGMGFLHSRNVVHRDLKPANVLLNDSHDVNICDFGLSRLLDPEMTSMTAEVGTPSYMAPEMATMGGIQCSTKGDVYSFGILLYSAWTRTKPYGDQGMNAFQLMTAVVNGLRPVIPINCPPGLAELMRSCWDVNPDCRPSFPEICLKLQDSYLFHMPSSNVSLKLDFHYTQAKLPRKKGVVDNTFSDAKSNRNYGTCIGSPDAISNRRESEADTLLQKKRSHEDDDALPS